LAKGDYVLVAGQKKRRSLLNCGRNMKGIVQLELGVNADVESAIHDCIRDIDDVDVLPDKEASESLRARLVSQTHRLDEDLDLRESRGNQGPGGMGVNLLKSGKAKRLEGRRALDAIDSEVGVDL
jgi:hypothetical protein